MLLKSIINFDSQNYPNKELIISYPKNDSATKELLQKLLRHLEQTVILIERNDDLTLGAARNEAVIRSNGEYICLWDDDDHYHTMRIAYQYNNMQTNGQHREACLITRVILHDRRNNKSYHSYPYYWEGTLLCQKTLVLKTPFTDDNTHEARALIHYLASNKLLRCIEDFALLYTYIYHGQNTISSDQFENMTYNSNILDPQNSDWVSANANQWYNFIL